MDEKAKSIYRKANQKFLQLTDEQCDMHYDIMQMPTTEWPQGVLHLITMQDAGEDEELRRICVAQWIKSGGKLEDPFAEESEEDAERGRIEALMALGGHPRLDPETAKKYGKK